MNALAACTAGDAVDPVGGGAPPADAADDGRPDARAAPGDAASATPPSGILVLGPKLLSQTGLYADLGARTLAAGVLEYAPRWPLWADGATKRRWIRLPQGQTVDTSDMNQWKFPAGTKMWKELSVGGKVVETRFLWKVVDGGWPYWWMGAYVWRADGSDAVYAAQGQPGALGTAHDVPSQTDCVRCHQGVADVGVGFSALQLSAPQTSQLALFSSMGLLSQPANREYDAPGASTTHDALAYLHANCGHCHVETSWLWQKQTKMVLRLRLSDVAPEDTGPYAAIGLATKHADPVFGRVAIAAGLPEQSQAWLRMNVRDHGAWQMPPVGTGVVDAYGSAVVGAWIAALPPGPDQ